MMTYFKQWLSEATNPRHVLLVEDSESDCQMIVNGSKDFNIEWTVTHTGEEAIKALEDREKKYRLIVLDLTLGTDPEGIELFRIIKKRWPWIPILVLSGYLDEAILHAITKTGFAMFMIKPKSFDQKFFGELFFALSIPRKVSAQGTEQANLASNI